MKQNVTYFIKVQCDMFSRDIVMKDDHQLQTFQEMEVIIRLASNYYAAESNASRHINFGSAYIH